VDVSVIVRSVANLNVETVRRSLFGMSRWQLKQTLFMAYGRSPPSATQLYESAFVGSVRFEVAEICDGLAFGLRSGYSSHVLSCTLMDMG